jgi:C-terminal processing protease CtpA/Prc
MIGKRVSHHVTLQKSGSLSPPQSTTPHFNQNPDSIRTLRGHQLSIPQRHAAILNMISIFFCSLCICCSPLSAQQQGGVTDKARRDGVIDSICRLLERKYVSPEEAKTFAQELHRRKSAGVYDSVTNGGPFAETITADLQAITGDKHVRVRLVEPGDIGERTESAVHHPVRLSRLRDKEHCGFYRLDWFEGNVGYIDVRRFYPPVEAGDIVAGIMKIFSGASAIIIDLRENQGGESDLGTLFCSYLFDRPTQLTGTYFRDDNLMQESWTRRIVQGKRLTAIPLFILTSEKTFSAAEYFAYDLKVTKRATIVGDSTKGGAHSVDLFNVDDQYEIYLSTARAINPVTRTNWEGTGVVPDVFVRSSSALDTAVVLARSAGEAFARTKEAELQKAVKEMEIHMDRAEKLFRENKSAPAEAALDSVLSSGDKVGLISEFFVDLLAYNYTSQKDERILYAILKKSIEFFPASSTAYRSLAYAYFRNGRREPALKFYQKALALDPDNRDAAQMIKRLTKD